MVGWNTVWNVLSRSLSSVGSTSRSTCSSIGFPIMDCIFTILEEAVIRNSWITLALAWPGIAGTVGFNRDIRPIFSDKCYTCHGPDKANRKSKLRFDTEAGAMADL